MSLRGLDPFKPEYTSDEDDIPSEVLNPCLRESVAYDRITAFFSSVVFAIVWKGLKPFLEENAGSIRIVCSPRVSESDAEGIRYGYLAQTRSGIADQLIAELDDMLDDERLRVPAQLMAALLASGRLEIRLAEVADGAPSAALKMFHDKVGVFTDADGDKVGFRGTMNETGLGTSPVGNIESIDVWPGWDTGRDGQRVASAVQRFERIWCDKMPRVDVTTLPAETIAKLEAVAEDVEIDALLEQIESLQNDEEQPEVMSVGGRGLRFHQKRAVRRWIANDRRGIVAHATGSGKTLTGLYCSQIALDNREVPVILVPSRLLLRQWAEAVESELGVPVIRVGDDNTAWRSRRLVAAALRSEDQRVIVAINDSFLTSEFQGQITEGVGRAMLVADEVHRVGAGSVREKLGLHPFEARLGLSATPERAGDPEGTSFLMDFFGGIIDEFSLADGIEAGFLAPYAYTPEAVYLTEEEQERWDVLSAEIGRLAAIQASTKTPDRLADVLFRRRIERSRIAKSAIAKVGVAARIVQTNYKQGQRWLVYCEGLDQLREVRNALTSAGIASWEYHSAMTGDRETTLDLFGSSGGIIVSIKCLDEGVDIPSASHALVLASSRNPREFIQRRGRILRESYGKAMAHLFDVLVLPNHLAGADSADSLVLGEIARAAEFARGSLTKAAVTILEDLWSALGRPLDELVQLLGAGIEVDEEENG